MADVYAEREVFRKGLFKLGILLENLDSEIASDSLLLTEGISLPGAGTVTTGGINARFYLDFRDREIFANRGIEFLIENSSYVSMNGASGNFGMAESYLKCYGTVKLLLPVTLVLKLGGSRNYGREIPFFRYTYIGQYNNLRGYLRNRFTGDASAYLNSELRLHFGKIRNLFLPFETGLTGFYDMGKVWFGGKSEGGWHATELPNSRSGDTRVRAADGNDLGTGPAHGRGAGGHILARQPDAAGDGAGRQRARIDRAGRCDADR